MSGEFTATDTAFPPNRLISVAGLPFSAGMMGSSRPAIGHKPMSGLWGADEGAKHYADRGPVEHQ
jgi:hypothetical protein